jgi:hypothetical protein
MPAIPQLLPLGIPDARESRRFVHEHGHFQLFRRPLVVHLIGDRWHAEVEDISILAFHCSALPMLGTPGLSARQQASTRTAVLLSCCAWRLPNFRVSPRGFWHRYAGLVGQAEARVRLSEDFRRQFFMQGADASRIGDAFGEEAQQAFLASEPTWLEAARSELLACRRTYLAEQQRELLVRWALAIAGTLTGRG